MMGMGALRRGLRGRKIISSRIIEGETKQIGITLEGKMTETKGMKEIIKAIIEAEALIGIIVEVAVVVVLIGITMEIVGVEIKDPTVQTTTNISAKMQLNMRTQE